MLRPIFDIDGTLVQSYALDGELFFSAVRQILGPVHIDVDWESYPDVTDPGILRKILSDHQFDTTPECVTAVQEVLGRLCVECAEAGRWSPVPGALKLFDHLHRNFPGEIGVSTGGWGNVARIKLSSAGFKLNHIALAASDVSAKRVNIMKNCCFLIGASNEQIAYFGDGEWDLRASRELGWRFIGVGERLRGKCRYWIPDYTDQNQVLSFLRGV